LRTDLLAVAIAMPERKYKGQKYHFKCFRSCRAGEHFDSPSHIQVVEIRPYEEARSVGLLILSKELACESSGKRLLTSHS